ncbi:betaine/proline/choline family ABC transporter ATP-binding protein [Streptomyces sp. LHD-70]|uniref:quaternary amine ABC transporter ATP-binding protein n=1 Tax=Streptomyces sp. LHD-70 TaxID=3072140 RepID=UPI00280F81D1|nr:betaine/proline/choline family ABC transporter ATP-binding protein [Streptomyces sp. LHD-70]MDQ8708109.1 betaine/proline/choline family ABC transporter ATP-binding protein [Streptomyces sp. LHD-70]
MIEAVGLRKIYEKNPSPSSTQRPWGRRAPADPPSAPAVDDVSFEVADGELFVIMGLSGSGKSTLLRMLNRLVEPTAGALRIGGRSVLDMNDVELRELRNRTVNMVFQHFGLLPHRTVVENAAYGLQVRDVTEKERFRQAREALEVVGLGSWGDVLPSELSGGMRQRVGLARALATDADILLMDEPFSALDPLIRRDMQELLLELQAELHKTIVFVTHDLNEAMHLGHRVMIMRDGKAVQLGGTSEILTAPADDYVADFVADVDRSRIVSARHVMCEPQLTACVGDKPEDVGHRLESTDLHAVFVLDGTGAVLGVARELEISRAVREGRTSMADVPLDTCEHVAPDTPLIELCTRVGGRPVPLAVTDDQKQLIGVIPRSALLNALGTHGRNARV